MMMPKKNNTTNKNDDNNKEEMDKKNVKKQEKTRTVLKWKSEPLLYKRLFAATLANMPQLGNSSNKIGRNWSEIERGG